MQLDLISQRLGVRVERIGGMVLLVSLIIFIAALANVAAPLLFILINAAVLAQSLLLYNLGRLSK